MFKLIVFLCMMGTDCVAPEHTLRVQEELIFNSSRECQMYADGKYIADVERKYYPKWELWGALCINDSYRTKEKGGILEI